MQIKKKGVKSSIMLKDSGKFSGMQTRADNFAIDFSKIQID